ncbi:50S ribosomal protein L11 methyltransferase [Clostridium sp. MSJ-8]|uniref:50S ribosomal protein L11 methyltransferase n=1 Tax=Clostridium sp. MSJ-8 TaxID=2841510 RepID=UPI001C0ED4AE|nr:50S ribosomal protein L11 methyltransferase [Clostridium sp. MSJ-8]MBU5487146.1 50S ribosomal protein L11 methyltransferase [Clostridium sp. MSJ-8]
MFILCYQVPYNRVDNIIENLQINDIYDVFYESPIEITTDDNGYDYIVKEDELVTLKVAFTGEFEELKSFNNIVQPIVGEKCFNILEEEDTSYDDFSIPAIDIDETWVLASPEEEVADNKKKINFISQGAFGTGLHETTQDLLRVILSKDFEGKKVLDIGTGSGILSIATAIKGASSVTALDIRDVTDEVLLNASLNNLSNIEVKIGDVLSNEVSIDDEFDWIYINIGGDETKMFMDYIKDHLKQDGYLLVSGLVEWNYDKVKNIVEEHGFTLTEKHQSNEWCTAIFANK